MLPEIALPASELPRGWEPKGSAGVQPGGGGEHRAVLDSWAGPAGLILEDKGERRTLLACAAWVTHAVSLMLPHPSHPREV